MHIIPEPIKNEPLEIMKQRIKTLKELKKLQDMLIAELEKRKKLKRQQGGLR